MVRLMVMKILGREHEGDARDFGVQLDSHHGVNDGSGDKLMPIDPAIDDQSSPHNDPVASGFRQQFRLERNFQTPRDFEEINLLAEQAVSCEFGGKGVSALIDDVLVSTCLNKRNAIGGMCVSHGVASLLVRFMTAPNHPRGSETPSVSAMEEGSAADENSITHLGKHSAPIDEENTMNFFDEYHENTSCEYIPLGGTLARLPGAR